MITRVLAPTPANVREAGEAIRRGELVAMPTETVYGLAANALSVPAVAKVFAAKERPTFDPLIVHVAETGARDLRKILEESGLVGRVTAVARARAARLATAFWPGPLTLVLPRGEKIPDLVTAGLETVGLRMPRHPVAQALLRAAGVPLAAPSANRFGRISPTRAEDVASELDGRVEIVLDGGPCEVGVESTVLEVRADGALVLLRPGAVPVEAIAAAAGIVPEARAGVVELHASPGMSPRHYAPGKPLVLAAAPLSQLAALPAGLPPRERLGVLVISGASTSLRRFHELAGGRAAAEIALSAEGDLADVARSLFAQLHRLDRSREIDGILAEPPPGDAGLAHAIRDRLTRASRHA